MGMINLGFPSGWICETRGSYSLRMDRRGLCRAHYSGYSAENRGYSSLSATVSIPPGTPGPYVVFFYSSAECTGGCGADASGEQRCSARLIRSVAVNEARIWKLDVAVPDSGLFCADISAFVQTGVPFLLSFFLEPARAEDNRPEHADNPAVFSKSCCKATVWWGDIRVFTGIDARRKPSVGESETVLRVRNSADAVMPAGKRARRKPSVGESETDMQVRKGAENRPEPHHARELAPVLYGSPLPEGGFPVSCGIFLPEGYASDASGLSLSANGRHFPFGACVLNRWPDGSARWIRTDLTLSAGIRSVSFESGAAQAPSSGFSILFSNNGYMVNTGKLTARMVSGSANLLEYVTVGGVRRLKSFRPGAQDTDGSSLSSVTGKIRLIYQNSFCLEFSVPGALYAGDEPKIFYDLRLRFYVGSATLIGSFSFYYAESCHDSQVILRFIPPDPDKYLWQQGEVCENAHELRFISDPGLNDSDCGWFGALSGNKIDSFSVTDCNGRCPASVSLVSQSADIMLDACQSGMFCRFVFDFGRTYHKKSLPRLIECMKKPPRLFDEKWRFAAGAFSPAAAASVDPGLSDAALFENAAAQKRPAPGSAQPGIKAEFPETTAFTSEICERMNGFLSSYLSFGDERFLSRAEYGAHQLIRIFRLSVPGETTEPGLELTLSGLCIADGAAALYRITGNPIFKEALLHVSGRFLSVLSDRKFHPPLGECGNALNTLAWAYDETRDKRYSLAIKQLLDRIYACNTTGARFDRRRCACVESFGGKACVPLYDMAKGLALPAFRCYLTCGDKSAAAMTVGIAESLLCEKYTDSVPDAQNENGGLTLPNNAKRLSPDRVLFALAYDVTKDAGFIFQAPGQTPAVKNTAAKPRNKHISRLA